MPSSPFGVVTSRAVPLLIPNVDTDVIIRVERMMTADPESLRRWAFEAIRYDSDGALRPDCVLNAPEFAESQILLAGDNFGCGSSREPAVWAIMALGFRVVVASSFGDIFAANCLTNGVLPVSLPDETVIELADSAQRSLEITVDLSSQEVRLEARSWKFEVGQVHKLMLLDGLDEMGLAVRSHASVERWEGRDRRDRPWAWPQRGRRADPRATEGCV